VILVDTSVWIGHLRTANSALAARLLDADVMCHGDDEVLAFIDVHRLARSGIGYIDAHLLAAVMLTPGTTIWTTDKRLGAAASLLGIRTVWAT
jgi:predicted nucleic acid-binding protein